MISMQFLENRNSFIHFRYFSTASSGLLLSRGAPDYSIDTVSELTHRSDIIPLRDWLVVNSSRLRSEIVKLGYLTGLIAVK